MIGILGGTFDPPHLGHIMLAKNFIDLLGLDELVWLPAGQPWQKSSSITPASLRYEMTITAAKDLLSLYSEGTCPASIIVSKLELDRTGPSYTIDTARELRKIYGPKESLVWLMGADSYQNLPSWNDWQKLPDYLHLAVASRRSSPDKKTAFIDQTNNEKIDDVIRVFENRMTQNAKDLVNFAFGKVLFDESFQVDLSSTELRHQLHQGVAKEHLISAVSPSVLQCIFSQNIYAGSKNKD